MIEFDPFCKRALLLSSLKNYFLILSILLLDI
jgi:hypothetical protein